MFSLLLFALIQPTDAIEKDKAEQKDKEVRYLHVSDAATYEVLSFALNSVSRSKKIHKPFDLQSDGFVRINLSDYKIAPKTWDSIQSDHPYSKKYIRADWFVDRALRYPYYNKLLKLSNLRSFYDLIGFTENKELRFDTCGMLLRSFVVRHGQIITRTPTLTGGCMWTTQESEKIFDDIGKNIYTQKQIAATLPNGLLGYFIVNPKPKTSDEKLNSITSTDEMIDYSSFPISLVRCASSCVSCHSQGIESFKCDIRESGLDVKAKEESVADLFSADLYKLIKRDQNNYDLAVKLATGKSAKDLNILYRKVIERYNAPVTFKVAAKEIGLPIEQFRAVCINSGDAMLQLLTTRNIRRDNWEALQKYLRAD